MNVDWSSICNPVIDRGPSVSSRDPALQPREGAVSCFYTAVEREGDRTRAYVDVAESDDLVHWSLPRHLTPKTDLNFSSPGCVLGVRDRWLLCVQSYPTPPGEIYAGEDARLWLMSSGDLESWNDPVPLAPEGCRAAWSSSRRQIDPFLVEHDDRWWCFYKTSGSLGLLVSRDLAAWEEASPGRPVLSPADTPDGATVENPCVVRDAGGFVLFFSPCRPGRGIGVARSDDLVRWRDVRYLDFPRLPWAQGGPSAAFVQDWRGSCGRWVMAFHGEREGPLSAALGLAWSEDLDRWQCP